jgi:hypothetical protein
MSIVIIQTPSLFVTNDTVDDIGDDGKVGMFRATLIDTSCLPVGALVFSSIQSPDSEHIDLQISLVPKRSAHLDAISEELRTADIEVSRPSFISSYKHVKFLNERNIPIATPLVSIFPLKLLIRRTSQVALHRLAERGLVASETLIAATHIADAIDDDITVSGVVAQRYHFRNLTRQLTCDKCASAKI